MPKYTWRYRGMHFDSEHAELYSKGIAKIPKAYNRQGIIWDRANKSEEGYDVIFWDWDGTIIRHYSALSFITKYFDLFNNGQTEWPFQCHPKWTASRIFHDGRSPTPYVFGNGNIMWDPDEVILEPDGYNWTFAGAMRFVLRYGMCDIGLMYSTPCTLQWIQTDKDNATAYFKWGGSYTIDYGDGSEPKQVSLNDVFYPSPAQHTYEKQGLYLVKITGNHYGGAQEDESFVYPGTTARMAAWRRTSIDQTTAINISLAGYTSLSQEYAYRYYLNSSVNTFALYAGPECRLNRFALDSTWLGALGLSDETGMDKDTVQIAENIFGDFQHVNIPKGWTTLLKTTSTTKYTLSGVYGGDNEAASQYASIFARVGDKLKHFCLPEGFSGNLFINNATALERVILSPYSSVVGMLEGIGSALKTLLIPIWVESNIPEQSVLRKGTSVSPDLQVLVPYVINGYYATLNESYSGWYYGDQWIKNMFTSLSNEKWLADYVKSAEYYSNYWQWSD